MADLKRDLLFRFLGDSKDLQRASGDAERSLKGVERQGGGTGMSLESMVKRGFGAVAAGVGIAELGQFVLKLGDVGQRAEMAAESFDKIFGPAAARLRTEAEDTRRVMGLSAGEFETMAVKLGLLITGQGVGAEQAATYVQDLVEKGGDLAAFNGRLSESSVAVDAITAALRGEFDPLEQWGVKLSAAAIEAEKARLRGTDPLFASLSDGEQTMEAVFALIEQRAAPAMGALEDAAGSAAGKANELHSRLDDLKEQLGREVVPYMEQGAEAGLSFFRGLEFLGDGSVSTGAKLGQLGLSVYDLGQVVAGVVFPWNDLTQQVGRAETKMDAAHKTAAAAARSEQWQRLADQAAHVGESMGDAADAAGELGPEVDEAGAALQRQLPWAEQFAAAIRGSRIAGGLIGGVGGTVTKQYQKGGRVPGPTGEPQLAVVHGGEEIIGNHEQHRGGGAPMVFQVTIHAEPFSDPYKTAALISELLELYQRSNGSRPVSIGTVG